DNGLCFFRRIRSEQIHHENWRAGLHGQSKLVPKLERVRHMMQQAIGDRCISKTHSSEILNSFTAKSNPIGQTGPKHRIFSYPYHWFRGIDCSDATRGQCPREPDRNVAWTTTQVEHMPFGKFRKVFAETIDEALIFL